MKIWSIILLLLFFWSCKQRRENQISKIEIALVSGWEDGRRAISIDTSLKYVFFGDGISEKMYFKKGYFEGRVSDSFWDTLNTRFTKEKLAVIKTDSDKTIADASVIELIIHWKNDKVQKLSLHLPLVNDTLKKDATWLFESCKTVKLLPREPLLFETTIQKPLPYVVPPGIFFLPPTKEKL